MSDWKPILSLIAASLSVATAAGQTSLAPLQPETGVVQQGVEVLTRGPVHEAFAEPLAAKPQATPVVPKAPPPPVEELPAEQKPGGDSVQWIPGYWAWDDDRNDYLWVSGFWRQPPPGRQWVPGHWHPVGASWQWVPGFWAPHQEQAALTYLPPPPPVLEAPPSVPPPGPNHTFVPGCWIFQGNRYVWRAGYWVPNDPGWLWVPAHYVWTPGGYLFVDGYWDYPLRQRGLLFAPVALDVRLIGRPAFVYQPRYIVHDECLYGALFVRPAYRHYYFGDYFEARYQSQGFTAWFDIRIGGGHDPLFAYYRAHQVDHRGWEHEMRNLYAARTAGTAPRPPRTLVEQNTIVQNITINNTTVNNVRNTQVNNLKQVTMVSPLSQVNKTDLNLKPVSPATLQAQKDAAVQLQSVSRERRQLESHLQGRGQAPAAVGQSPAKTVQLNLPPAAPHALPAGTAPPPLPTRPQHHLDTAPARPNVPPPPVPAGGTHPSAVNPVPQPPSPPVRPNPVPAKVAEKKKSAPEKKDDKKP